jgi:hypothetical protein
MKKFFKGLAPELITLIFILFTTGYMAKDLFIFQENRLIIIFLITCIGVVIAYFLRKNKLEIKKHRMIRVIVFFITIPILFLTMMEVVGDGVGFSTIYGRYKTERFLSYVESGKFISATRYMAFSGGTYAKMENEEEASNAWATGMQDLKNENIEIISHGRNAIITDDGFTSGYVVITVAYKDMPYEFRLFISTNTGKVAPMDLRLNISGPTIEPTEVEHLLTEKITSVISTYNPG